MIRQKERFHAADVFAVLWVFLIFALLISGLLMAGIKVYGAIEQHTEENFNVRTSVQYLMNKSRSYDPSEVAVEEFDGLPTLVLKEKIDGEDYVTRIYCYERTMRELFTKADNILDPAAGTVITDLFNMEIEKVSDGLFRVTLTGTDKTVRSMALAIPEREAER